MHRLSAAAGFTFLVLVGGACDGGGSSDRLVPSAAPPATGTPAVALECPRYGEVISGEPRGSLSGDVNGDGSPDPVELFVDASGAPGCEAFLVVDGGAGGAVAVAQEGMAVDHGLPSLVTLAQIDGRPGLDVVARLVAGASTEFVGVFSAGGGDLRRLEVDDTAGLGGLFPHGGGVTHLDAVDCDGKGRVIVSSALSGDGSEYEVMRTTFEFEEIALVPVDVERMQVPAEDVASLPGFAGSPFGSCPRA